MEVGFGADVARPSATRISGGPARTSIVPPFSLPQAPLVWGVHRTGMRPHETLDVRRRSTGRVLLAPPDMAATRGSSAGGVRRRGAARGGRAGRGRLSLLREPAEAPAGPGGGRGPGDLAHRPGRTGRGSPASRLRLPGRSGRGSAAAVGGAPGSRRQRRRGGCRTRAADARRVELRNGEPTRVRAGGGLAGGPRVPGTAVPRPVRAARRTGQARRRVRDAGLRCGDPRSELLPASGDRRGTTRDGEFGFLACGCARRLRATPDPRPARRT